MEASQGIKARLVELKSKLNLKTDADVIAYLIVMHEEKFPGVTMGQDAEFRKKANELNN